MTHPPIESLLDQFLVLELLAVRAYQDLAGEDDSPFGADVEVIEVEAGSTEAVLARTFSELNDALDRARSVLDIEVEERANTWLDGARALILHDLGGDRPHGRGEAVLRQALDLLDEVRDGDAGDVEPELPRWACLEVFGRRTHHGRLRRTDDRMIEVVEPALEAALAALAEHDVWGNRQVVLLTVPARPRLRALYGRDAVFGITESTEAEVRSELRRRYGTSRLADAVFYGSGPWAGRLPWTTASDGAQSCQGWTERADGDADHDIQLRDLASVEPSPEGPWAWTVLLPDGSRHASGTAPTGPEAVQAATAVIDRIAATGAIEVTRG